MKTDSNLQELPEILQDYDIQQMVSLMRHIVLDYTGRNIKRGFPIIVAENISGIVVLLDYLDGLEAYDERVPALNSVI